MQTAHFHMKGFALRVPFKTEAQQNSEMDYSHCETRLQGIMVVVLIILD